MTAPNAMRCPPESVLSDFGLGKLDANSADTISQHIETCSDCRQRVAGLSGDTFVGRLQKAGDAPVGDRRERTFVPGASLAGDAKRKEDGLPSPSRKAVGKSQDGLEGRPTKKDGLGSPSSSQDGLGSPSSSQDGLGRPPHGASPSSINAPPELANHPDFELVKELGQGGMGTVYLAKNRMMDRPEVLKVISKALLDRPGALERFQQEIRSAAKLNHSNIVAAYSVLRPGDLLIFAMEYVKGQDLSEVVKARGALPVPNAAFYIHQGANGLQHAFEKGMVHRDIKPNNLMLAIEGKKHTVKILDFGLAKATSEKGAETGLTKSGQMLGTPDYVAPEQTLDAHQADIRADIYSLGCTLYFLLSGGPPFQEQSLYAILEAHHTREPKPLNLVRPDVPLELAMVVSKMMAKDPAKRYQTPLEVAKALVPFFKPGQSVTAPPHEKPTGDTQYPQYTGDTASRQQSATPVGWALPTAPTAASQSRMGDGPNVGASLGSVQPASAQPTSALVGNAHPTPTAMPVPVAIAPVLVQAAPPAEGFSVSIDVQRPSAKRRNWWSALLPWQQLAIAAGSAASVLLLGVVLLVRTPKGTVEIELSDPDAKVSVAVDGNRIDIAGLDEPLSLEVGEHEYTVKGDGFETRTKRFRVIRGENAPLTITLAPKSQPALQTSEAETVAAPRSQPSPTPRQATDIGGTTTDGFVSLFNGKDLTGWKTHPSREGLWRVENGVLIGSGSAASCLFSACDDFKDFHLRVEARINDGGDSGVYFRSNVNAFPWQLSGYEVEVKCPGNREHLTCSLNGPTGTRVTAPRSSVEPGRWFTLDVIALGSHLLIKVNGQTTADDRASLGSGVGHIALQQHDPQTVVEFRKIEIKELQSVAEDRPQIAPPDAREFGGHWYKFYPAQLSWKAARDRCQALGGQLVVIDSLEENAFVGSLVEKAAWQDAWIGATDESEEGKWRDVDGKLLSFTNWLADNPNNKNGEEHYALLSNRTVSGTEIRWRWCDQPNESKQFQPGFVGEWLGTTTRDGAAPKDSPAPSEPNVGGSLGDPTGTWKWSVRFNNQSRDFAVSIKLEGDKLIGMLLDNDGRGTRIEDVSFSHRDGELAFKFTRERNGQRFTVKYHGKLSGDTIKGATEFEVEGQTKSRGWEAKRERSTPEAASRNSSVAPLAIAPFDAEQARAHQDAWAKNLGLPLEYTNSIGMKLKLIPPGTFMMGGTPDEIDAAIKSTSDRGLQGWYRGEAPRHHVTLTKPFYLGAYEVTQGQYKEVTGVNPSHFTPGKPGAAAVKGLDVSKHPVETVSWPVAIDFCNKLSVKEGLPEFYARDGNKVTTLASSGYRLPTEAEWEYACRAGSAGRWSFGDDESELPKHAWFAANSGGRPHAVGELQPNAFGLYDMHGNCTERIWDLFGGYTSTEATDPTGAAASTGRMARGGAFISPLFEVRAAGRRESAVPGYKANFNTFRVARTAVPPPADGSARNTLQFAPAVDRILYSNYPSFMAQRDAPQRD